MFGEMLNWEIFELLELIVLFIAFHSLSFDKMGLKVLTFECVVALRWLFFYSMSSNVL